MGLCVCARYLLTDTRSRRISLAGKKQSGGNEEPVCMCERGAWAWALPVLVLHADRYTKLGVEIQLKKKYHVMFVLVVFFIFLCIVSSGTQKKGKHMMSIRLAPTSDALWQISHTHVPSSQRPASTQSSQPVTGVQIHACRTGRVTTPIWDNTRDMMRLERPDVAFEVVKDIPGGGGAKRFTFFASSDEFFKWTVHLHQ